MSYAHQDVFAFIEQFPWVCLSCDGAVLGMGREITEHCSGQHTCFAEATWGNCVFYRPRGSFTSPLTLTVHLDTRSGTTLLQINAQLCLIWPDWEIAAILMWGRCPAQDGLCARPVGPSLVGHLALSAANTHTRGLRPWRRISAPPPSAQTQS